MMACSASTGMDRGRNEGPGGQSHVSSHLPRRPSRNRAALDDFDEPRAGSWRRKSGTRGDEPESQTPVGADPLRAPSLRMAPKSRSDQVEGPTGTARHAPVGASPPLAPGLCTGVGSRVERLGRCYGRTPRSVADEESETRCRRAAIVVLERKARLQGRITPSQIDGDRAGRHRNR